MPYNGAEGQVLADFHKSNWIPVYNGSDQKDFAWTGGVNASLFNKMDFDNDGREDVLIYDRSSERPMTFRNVITPEGKEFQYAPIYESIFPEIENWILLRDYDCDGKKDIFTSAPGGIKVYRNISASGLAQFELITTLLNSYYDFGSDPFITNIYVSSVDIPSIADHDGDGDLDILTFSLSVSGAIEYHKNFSQELYGNCDSLAFELRNQCYGYVKENSMSPDISLGEPCPFNVPGAKMPEPGRHGLHAGSTICTFDYDQNGYKEMLIGDITADSLTLLYNGPSIDGSPDSIFAKETCFPVAGIPAKMHTFLTGFYEDINFDDVPDLIVTTNDEVGSEDIANMHLYLNDGLIDLPNFQFATNSFMVDEMIDHGTVSFPHLFDHNADGLPDLIVSNRGLFNGGNYDPSLYLYENTGAQDFPEFTLINEDYAGLSGLGLDEVLYPTFGDLDGDGDQDMIVGDKSGKHRLFENTAGQGNTANFVLSQLVMLDNLGNDLDPGQWVTPQLFDIDDDNDLDLIVGERNGNVNFYRNIGNVETPNFMLENDTLGNFSVDVNGDLVGHSVPFIFKHNGTTELLVSNDEGQIFHINEIDGNLDGTFNIIDSTLYDLSIGERGSAILFDFNGDGQFDMITGNESGGLSFYGGGIVGENELISTQEFSIYPNPSNGFFVVESINQILLDRIEVYTIYGQKILNESFQKTQIKEVDLSQLSNGVYLVNIYSDSNVITKRIIRK